MKSWVKLYTEICREHLLMSLTWEERGLWTSLLALAGEIDDKDGDGAETGMLYSLDNTAWMLRCETEQLASAVASLQERGLITVKGNILYVSNYDRYLPDRGRPQSAVARWRAQIFARDDFTCQECGKRGVRLQAHHILPWHLAPEGRYDVTNGITLCRDCHRRLHGRGWKRQARRADSCRG